MLRPAEPLGLRPGERVNLIVIRRPDPSRWDFARLARAANGGEDLDLARQGLAEWAGELDATEVLEARRGLVGRPRCVSTQGTDGAQACSDLAK